MKQKQRRNRLDHSSSSHTRLMVSLNHYPTDLFQEWTGIAQKDWAATLL